MIVPSLAALCERLRSGTGMRQKTDIALAYDGCAGLDLPCDVGDDCAALPDGDGFALFAIEGLLETFVAREPWFAGFSGVMVNVSDVAAMGGRPTAVVDALWTRDRARGEAIFAGMREASRTFGVPIVGGHTNARAEGERLAVAILGRAKRLLTSFDARPGDVVLSIVDLRGAYVEPYPYWNATTGAPPARLRADLELLPEIAEARLCGAAKDVSMAGLLGTLLMLLECSHVGATIDLDAIPRPADGDLERWLACFPSYGFLLSAPPQHVDAIVARFRARDLACAPIGAIEATRVCRVVRGFERETFWDLAATPFTGARGVPVRA